MEARLYQMLIELKKHLNKFFGRIHFSRNKLSCAAALYFLSVLAVIFASCAAYSAGYRWNRTPSVARGLWKVVHDYNAELQKGDYVTVATEKNPGYAFALERGYAEKNSIFIKKIVATQGDFVDYDVVEKSVTVNGEFILMTEVRSMDSQGLPLYGASFPVRIQEGDVWLSSEYIRGFDSRYFGPVSSDALTKALPVWVFR